VKWIAVVLVAVLAGAVYAYAAPQPKPKSVAAEVRALEKRVKSLERQVARKTLTKRVNSLQREVDRVNYASWQNFQTLRGFCGIAQVWAYLAVVHATLVDGKTPPPLPDHPMCL
jgi:uncharacterized protein YlxW (UPF0749 family)